MLAIFVELSLIPFRNVENDFERESSLSPLPVKLKLLPLVVAFLVLKAASFKVGPQGAVGQLDPSTIASRVLVVTP